MLTSVVIPCHDGADDTSACLRALAASEGPEGEVEVVLVDNGSRDPDALVQAAASHPRARIVRLPANLGFAGGVNRGLAQARGEILAVLNNDTLPAPHMLGRLQRALALRSAPAMVAPVSNYVKGSARLPVGDRGRTPEGLAEVEAQLDEACAGMVQDVDSLAGLCLVFRRALWQEVGGFDETFGLGNFEDDDFALRVRLRGGRLLVVRDAFLHHHGSRTFTALGVDYQAQMARNGALLDAKWRHEPAWRALQAAAAGDVAAAGRLAEQALVAHRRWPEGHLLVARAATASGDAATACSAAARYLQACPTSWTAHVAHTHALLAGGRLHDAARGVRHALALCHVENEPAADLVCRLAQALAAEGRRAAAREALAAALELAPHGDRFTLLGAWHAADGDLEAAAHAFAAGAEQGCGEARLQLGLCQWQLGEHGPALRSLAGAFTERPGDARTREALAAALAACRAAGLDVAAAERTLAAATAAVV